MKTDPWQAKLDLKTSVYILPLRNENTELVYLQDYKFSCLYPTFKEWKPAGPADEHQYPGVYILPLRNENCPGRGTRRVFRTCLYPTFKEWKRHEQRVSDLEFQVYILPLRNENKEFSIPSQPPLSLYPTFKEWKHGSSVSNVVR